MHALTITAMITPKPADTIMPNTTPISSTQNDLAKEAKRLNTFLRKAPSKTQWRFAKKVCGNSRHVRIREFMVIDGKRFNNPRTQSVVYHVAGALWMGYDIPFEELVAILKANPEHDEEVILSIYSV